MNKFTQATGAIAILALAMVGVPAAQQQPQQQQPATGQGQQMRDFDLRFIDMTANHHEVGLKMAQMAERKAQDPKLKAKAAEMVRDQKQEIQRLEQLRSRLYPDAPRREPMGGMMGGRGAMGGRPTTGEKGQQPKGTMGMGMGTGDPMGQMNRLEELKGAEFDQAFAQAMIQHHQMQLRMSERALDQATHDEVREMAKEITERQKQDVAELQKYTGAGR